MVFRRSGPVFGIPVVILVLLLLDGGCDAALSGDFIFRSLIHRFHPDAIELVLDAEPDETGAVRRLYAALTGAVYEGIRIDSLSLEAVFCVFRTVRDSGGTELTELASSVNGYFDARLRERDLNDFLVGRVVDGNGDEKWKKVRVDFLPSRLSARGYYSNSGLTALVELDGMLELVDGTQVILSDYALRINNADQASFVEEAIRKAQPLLDFRKFPFPVVLKSLVITDDSISLATRVPPKRFKGIVFRYGKSGRQP